MVAKGKVVLMRMRALVILSVISAFVAVTGGRDVAAEEATRIEIARLSSIVRELASDDYEGRAPGTPGGPTRYP